MVPVVPLFVVDWLLGELFLGPLPGCWGGEWVLLAHKHADWCGDVLQFDKWGSFLPVSNQVLSGAIVVLDKVIRILSLGVVDDLFGRGWRSSIVENV